MLSNNDNNNQDDIYSAVIMTTGHCESSLGSFDECIEQHQAAADPQTKPPDFKGGGALCAGNAVALLVFGPVMP